MADFFYIPLTSTATKKPGESQKPPRRRVAGGGRGRGARGRRGARRGARRALEARGREGRGRSASTALLALTSFFTSSSIQHHLG